MSYKCDLIKRPDGMWIASYEGGARVIVVTPGEAKAIRKAITGHKGVTRLGRKERAVLRKRNNQKIIETKDKMMACREAGLMIQDDTSGRLGSNLWQKQNKIVTMRVSIRPGEGKQGPRVVKHYKRFGDN